MKRILIALGALAVAACAATPTLAPAGDYGGAGGYVVTLERPWTEMPKEFSTATDTPYLTVDGPRLNRLHLFSGVPSGSGIIKTRKDEQERVPVFRAGMSELELVEFVTDSVEMLGLRDVTALEARPRALAGSDGVWFEFSAAQENGLRLKGAALAAETNGALDLMLFVAPEVHYYDAFGPEVERLFASARRT